MQDYKLALIASQSQQKAAPGDPKSAHCHTEPLISPLVPTPHRAIQETHNDTLRNGHFQETAWRRSSAPPGAPGAREVIARGCGWAGCLLPSDPVLQQPPVPLTYWRLDEWVRPLSLRSTRPSALPGRCLSADRVPAAQPWGRGASGAGAAASPAARARSAAPGRPRLQPEPDSRRRQRRRHLRLLPREGGGQPARKPGPRGVASRARLAPLYSMSCMALKSTDHQAAATLSTCTQILSRVLRSWQVCLLSTLLYSHG